MKTKTIPVIVGAFDMIKKGTQKYVNQISGNLSLAEIQKIVLNSTAKHFRPKIVYWNKRVNCTPINRALKMWFNKGSSSFLRPTVPEFFLESIVLFFGQNKYTNIRRFLTIFHHKTRFFNIQKVQKLKVAYFHCLLKPLKYKYCPKFWTCPK